MCCCATEEPGPTARGLSKPTDSSGERPSRLLPLPRRRGGPLRREDSDPPGHPPAGGPPARRPAPDCDAAALTGEHQGGGVTRGPGAGGCLKTPCPSWPTMRPRGAHLGRFNPLGLGYGLALITGMPRRRRRTASMHTLPAGARLGRDPQQSSSPETCSADPDSGCELPCQVPPYDPGLGRAGTRVIHTRPCGCHPFGLQEPRRTCGPRQFGPTHRQPYSVPSTWLTLGSGQVTVGMHTSCTTPTRGLHSADLDVTATVTGPTRKREGNKTEREHKAIVPHVSE